MRTTIINVLLAALLIVGYWHHTKPSVSLTMESGFVRKIINEAEIGLLHEEPQFGKVPALSVRVKNKRKSPAYCYTGIDEVELQYNGKKEREKLSWCTSGLIQEMIIPPFFDKKYPLEECSQIVHIDWSSVDESSDVRIRTKNRFYAKPINQLGLWEKLTGLYQRDVWTNWVKIFPPEKIEPDR